MIRRMLLPLLLCLIVATPQFVQGQTRRRPSRGSQDTAARRPNDQVEGRLWEYKGELKTTAKGAEKPKLEGRFRVEGAGVFAAPTKVTVKPGSRLRQVAAAARAGESVEVDAPGRTEPKRIGEYHTLKSGKIRIEFDDDKSLAGVMVLQLKNKTRDTYVGTFTEMIGKKKGRTWQMLVRPIQD